MIVSLLSVPSDNVFSLRTNDLTIILLRFDASPPYFQSDYFDAVNRGLQKSG